MKALNLHKSYGTKQNPIVVLKDISLEIEEGTFALILGPSGSGKSTLLNVLSGLETVEQGHIFYGNQDISTLNDSQTTAFRKDNIAFIFQQYYLLPQMDVEKNIRMGADLIGNKDYLEIIEAVGLADKLHKFPSELSGGEQQRVAIARALAKKPKVLFLDEPTGALDEETGRSVLDYIATLQKKLKFTMIMVTHNQNISEMADMVIHMNSGSIRSIERNDSLKTAYEIGW